MVERWNRFYFLQTWIRLSRENDSYLGKKKPTVSVRQQKARIVQHIWFSYFHFDILNCEKLLLERHFNESIWYIEGWMTGCPFLMPSPQMSLVSAVILNSNNQRHCCWHRSDRANLLFAPVHIPRLSAPTDKTFYSQNLTNKIWRFSLFFSPLN